MEGMKKCHVDDSQADEDAAGLFENTKIATKWRITLLNKRTELAFTDLGEGSPNVCRAGTMLCTGNQHMHGYCTVWQSGHGTQCNRLDNVPSRSTEAR